MTAHYRRYLCEDPESRTDESGYPYKIEDGVNVDFDPKPFTREHNTATRYATYDHPTHEQLLAEEAAWAAKSGPVITRKKDIA